ncbi:MAG: hypothetical protein JWO31_3577 [Phycisphaerales bacterium]|nr:hypothetical protein [Phycisphaerales bacterium]
MPAHGNDRKGENEPGRLEGGSATPVRLGGALVGPAVATVGPKGRHNRHYDRARG